MSQLKEQHSLELAKQRTKLEDACKHYQNTLKDEQGKLQLREEELGAANSEISRIKSELAAKTDAVGAQKALVMELQQKIGGLEADLTSEKIKSEAARELEAKVHALTRDVRSGFESLQICREQRALLFRTCMMPQPQLQLQ